VSAVRWLSPSPLWDDLLGAPAAFRAPALLRFAGDDFAEQFAGALAEEPRRLRRFVARAESWRAPAAGLDAPASSAPLRLYQPVHGRFYYVAATLACRVPGLPEHTVDAARGELCAFVVRRVTVTAGGAETGEWAWIKRPDGREGWVRAAGAALAADEELVPMFGAGYAGSGGLRSMPMRRRVFAGLIPASRREAYANGRELAAQAPLPAPGSLDDPRTIEFQRAVLDPWTELRSWFDGQHRLGGKYAASAFDGAETSSAFLLLDFYDYLAAELPRVREAVDGTRAPATLGAQRPLFDALAGLSVVDRDGGSRVSLAEAMRAVLPFRAGLEALDAPTQRLPAGYGPARVLVGDVRAADPHGARAGLDALFARLAAPLELDDPPVGVRVLKKLVMDALAAQGAAPAVVPEQLPARTPANARGDDWFVVRCVYLKPNCGRKTPPVVSDRSERFRLVSFFDADAPARQLRVALPVDTSPATLRKYNRNVAFVISDQLRKQMSRAADMKKLLDGEAGPEDGGITFGMICSFSIPIITICAFILLMILVSLLNIIFWWIPLFRICFPVPKLKG
jgi:hypothetical protein